MKNYILILIFKEVEYNEYTLIKGTNSLHSNQLIENCADEKLSHANNHIEHEILQEFDW